MNEMIKALSNKIPCRVGQWNTRTLDGKIRMEDLLTELPEDVDFVESYIFDYNIVWHREKPGYVKLNIYYTDLTSIPDIQSVVIQLKKPREIS